MEDAESVIQIPVGLPCLERGRLIKKRSCALYGWSNKPPPLVWKMPSRLFKYRWVSLALKEGALRKKDVVHNAY